MLQQRFIVRRSFLWAGRNYKKGDELIPETPEQVQRANVLARSGGLAAIIDEGLLGSLQAAGLPIAGVVAGEKGLALSSSKAPDEKGDG